MKIVQVLTYVSVDGAYGGPVAVARNQCEHLARLGHEVHLVAGWDGAATLDVPGVHVHLQRVRRVPGLGFAGYFSPAVWSSVWRLSSDADAVHFHFARDLVQLPAALLASLGRRKVVLQTHGMVRPDTRAVARLLDTLMVRPVYRRARRHLLLTQREVDELPAVAQSETLPWSRVRNAVTVPNVRAQWSDGQPTVLYLARLQERKRPVAFVEMASHLRRSGSTARFELVGADEGQADAVRATIESHGLRDVVTYRGPVDPDAVSGVLAGAQVYVLPSVDEPFPMSLLEAMAVGLPAVITDQTGLSEELADRGSAAVTPADPESMAAAVSTLLTSPTSWQQASDRARADTQTHFSSEGLAQQLVTIYCGGAT